MLNASLVEMDLNKFIEQLKEEGTWKDRDHNSITVYKSDQITIVLMGMHQHAELKTHTARGTITVQVLEGEIKFSIDQKNTSLQKGKMVALQANIPHSVLAVKESFFLLTMVAGSE